MTGLGMLSSLSILLERVCCVLFEYVELFNAMRGFGDLRVDNHVFLPP